jgi:AraC family transcriptional regulator of adaptative response/methylated-DNA-[protein]-cysteine methyltransferase
MGLSEHKDYRTIEKVIRSLERDFRSQPSLAEMARIAGLSEFHFHRLFTRWAGTTPKTFLKSLTATHAKELLRESRDLLDVSLDSGLSGPGRLHDLLVTVEGVSPGEFKARGAGLEIRYGFGASPFGEYLVALTPRGICHLSFVDAGGREGAASELEKAWPEARLTADASAAHGALDRVFSPKKRRPLNAVVAGSPFQLKVWQALLRIPAGRLLSYGDIASAIGHPGASRAVGTAVGSNSVAYLIPCHRVIRESGVIGDYRWGHARKRAILAVEHARNAASSLL